MVEACVRGAMRGREKLAVPCPSAGADAVPLCLPMSPIARIGYTAPVGREPNDANPARRGTLILLGRAGTLVLGAALTGLVGGVVLVMWLRPDSEANRPAYVGRAACAGWSVLRGRSCFDDIRRAAR